MKKLLLFAGILATLVSCNKETNLFQEAEESHLELNLTIDDGENTKAIKKGWSNNDAVYIFFDQQVVPLQYLRVKYNNSSKKWVADYWSDGLEAAIAGKTSGTLTALYIPNDKVYGSIQFSYSDANQFIINPKDKAGNTYWGYWLKDCGRVYTVSSNTLTAAISLINGYDYSITQFCIGSKDYDGNNIDNSSSATSTVYQYKLTLTCGNGTSYAIRPRLYYKPTDLIAYDTMGNGEMSAYFYGGLCFSCSVSGMNSTTTTKTFTLTDGTNTYKYTTTAAITGGNAYRLPDLDAKEGGVKKWVKQ